MATRAATCSRPHWAFKGGDRLLSADDVTFYEKGSVATVATLKGRDLEWSNTIAGHKAASAALRKLPTDNGDAPVRLAFAYTVEVINYRTVETREDGRPLDSFDRVAIIQWSARID